MEPQPTQFDFYINGEQKEIVFPAFTIEVVKRIANLLIIQNNDLLHLIKYS